ncbi:hypothetical protein [Vibrio diabolicus]|uniref:hypothetical protein n=1 Tax=Vibrio diabolicus TaxID=50719 RepID=UPI0035A60B57
MSTATLVQLCWLKLPAHLQKNNSWMNFEGWDQVLVQPEQQEYQQPDLSFFPEMEDDWPLN